MPSLLTSKDNHRERINIWAERVNDIDSIEWPDSFESDLDLSKKYNRFTEYVKEWMSGVLTSSEEKENDIHPSERGEEFYFGAYLIGNWWETAMKRSNGKASGSRLPDASFASEESKSQLYDRILPAYRAIKESFDKRPWYQWFTNHAQYTAERDALKGIKGMALTLTSDTPDTFDSVYKAYRDGIPMSEEADQAEIHNENEKAQENRVSIGKEIALHLEKPVDRRPSRSFREQLNEKLSDRYAAHHITLQRGVLKAMPNLDKYYHTITMGYVDRTMVRLAKALNEKVDNAISPTEKQKIMADGAKEIFGHFYVAASADIPSRNQAERLVMVQKITNLVLNIYSPAGFDKDRFGKYADNFILKDQDLARECMAQAHEGNFYFETDFPGDLENARNTLGIKEQVKIEKEPENQDISNRILDNDDNVKNLEYSLS